MIVRYIQASWKKFFPHPEGNFCIYITRAFFIRNSRAHRKKIKINFRKGCIPGADFFLFFFKEKINNARSRVKLGVDNRIWQLRTLVYAIFHFSPSDFLLSFSHEKFFRRKKQRRKGKRQSLPRMLMKISVLVLLLRLRRLSEKIEALD